MGDIADDLHDRMLDEDAEWAPPSERQHPKCRHCGSDAVMWLMVKGKWRLCCNETGEPHQCSAQSDFKQLKVKP